MKTQKFRMTKTILSNDTTSGGIGILDSKLYCRVIITKTVYTTGIKITTLVNEIKLKAGT